MSKIFGIVSLLFCIVFYSDVSFPMDPSSLGEVQPAVHSIRSCDFTNSTLDTVYITFFKPEIESSSFALGDFSDKIIQEIPVALCETRHVDFPANIRFFTICAHDDFSIIVDPKVYVVDSLRNGLVYKICWEVKESFFPAPRVFKQKGVFVVQA